MYEERFYRNLTTSKFQVEVSYKESDLLISTDKKIEGTMVLEHVKRYYGEIEQYINEVPLFLTSLSPMEKDESAPPIVREMLLAAHLTGIGPFSSVAGAIALYIGKDISLYADEVIVENGGDLFLKINEEKRLGIYLGEKAGLEYLSLRIRKRSYPFGIASSSSSFGHSLSLGRADLVTTIAQDALIADGFATAFANRIKNESSIKAVLSTAKKDPLIEGVVVCFEGKLFLWGDLEIDDKKNT